MPLFVVTYAHPNEGGWREQLAPHVAWLNEQVASGVLRASGPLPARPNRSALLMLAAADEAEVRALIATDPFAQHGLIDDLSVEPWDSIFGVFNADSSMPRS